MEKQNIILDSINAYNSLYGLPTHHPLVAVVDLKQSSAAINHIIVNYGIYALFLKNGVQCTLRYGRRKYDYQEGSVVSFSPGQVVEVEMDHDIVGPDVIGLLFHPDLIYGTPLADKMPSYSFFDYTQNEAVHLSADEKEKFLSCISLIKEEIEHPVDNHSAAVLSANIQVLLEYLHRFYDRQFITRHKVNSEVVAQFQKELKSYFATDKIRSGLPGVAYFAEKARLSPGYFGDLVKKETGSTPKDLIALHLLSVAKQRLASTRHDISEIAYDLGFEYPAHFTRMFKRMTGQSPTQYRTRALASPGLN